MSESPHVIDVNEADFEANVLAKSHEVPVVVDFWAEWCAPCRALGPVLEKLADRDQGKWILAKLDTETNREIANQFGIQGIPNVKAFVNGEVVDEFSGALSEYAVDKFLQKLVPSDADTRLGDAITLDKAGNVADAVEAYVEILGEDPDHTLARAALISALVRTNDLPEALGIVDEIASHQWSTTEGALERAWLAVEAASARSGEELAPLMEAGDLEARYELAMVHAALEDWEPAFEHLLHILATDRTFRDDIARIAMIRLFQIVGDDSDVTDKYRGRMGAVMYV